MTSSRRCIPLVRSGRCCASNSAFLIDGVLIDSPDAAQARSLQRQMQEMRERVPPPVIADLPAEIAALLARTEKGEWQAWCWLNLILMLTPKSSAIVEAMNYFITTMPGWASADEATRCRIVATAKTYLADAESSVDLWFGKNPMPLHSNDLSAVRAFILLRQQVSRWLRCNTAGGVGEVGTRHHRIALAIGGRSLRRDGPTLAGRTRQGAGSIRLGRAEDASHGKGAGPCLLGCAGAERRASISFPERPRRNAGTTRVSRSHYSTRCKRRICGRQNTRR